MNFNASEKEVELTNMVMSSRIKGNFNNYKDLWVYSTFAILEIFYYNCKIDEIGSKDYASLKIRAKSLTGRLQNEILNFLFTCACDDCGGDLSFEDFLDPDFKVKEDNDEKI